MPSCCAACWARQRRPIRRSSPASSPTTTRSTPRSSRSREETNPMSSAERAKSAMSRRQMLKMGSAGVAAAAVLAACGDSGGGTATKAGDATTTTAARNEGDITTLRTVNSLEGVAVAAYQAVTDKSKTLNLSTAVSGLISNLQKHHKDHSN